MKRKKEKREGQIQKEKRECQIQKEKKGTHDKVKRKIGNPRQIRKEKRETTTNPKDQLPQYQQQDVKTT